MLDVDEKRKRTDSQMTLMVTATLPVWSQSNGKKERRAHTREIGKMGPQLPAFQQGQAMVFIC